MIWSTGVNWWLCVDTISGFHFPDLKQIEHWSPANSSSHGMPWVRVSTPGADWSYHKMIINMGNPMTYQKWDGLNFISPHLWWLGDGLWLSLPHLWCLGDGLWLSLPHLWWLGDGLWLSLPHDCTALARFFVEDWWRLLKSDLFELPSDVPTLVCQGLSGSIVAHELWRNDDAWFKHKTSHAPIGTTQLLMFSTGS